MSARKAGVRSRRSLSRAPERLRPPSFLKLIELCRQKGLYDQPNERKVHHNKIPRLGGLLFAPAMSIGIVAGFLYLGVSVESSQLPVFRLSTMILMAGLFLIYLIGVLDDLLGLSARVKFAVQVAASAFMPLCGLYINNLYGLFGLWEIPFWAGSALTVFVCLLIVNSVNLIDGIDGLSSGLSMLALTAFAALFWELGVESYTLVSLGLIGAVAAFFFFNVFGSERRGTKTFMGDTGSLVLGYTLAYLSIKYAMNNPSVLAPRPHGMVVVITLLAVPVFDLVRVACMRLVHGKGIFHPDKTHIHGADCGAAAADHGGQCFAGSPGDQHQSVAAGGHPPLWGTDHTAPPAERSNCCWSRSRKGRLKGVAARGCATHPVR